MCKYQNQSVKIIQILYISFKDKIKSKQPIQTLQNNFYQSQIYNQNSKQPFSMLAHLILTNRLQSAKHYSSISPHSWKDLLLTHFKKGNRQQFFNVFLLLKKENKLEFYLRVYFLIFNIHPHLNQQRKNVQILQQQSVSFREYLQSKSVELAKSSEFLQFYALPFIKNPLDHATFKSLFTITWVSNLKQKLITYIQVCQQQMKKSMQSLSPKPHPQPIQPQYAILLQQHTTLQTLHQQMIQSFHNYMMSSQNKWFQNTKDLVRVAKVFVDLVTTANINYRGNQERKFFKAKKKLDNYQKFVNKRFQDLMSVSQDISVFNHGDNQMSSMTIKSQLTSKSWIGDKNSNIGNNAISYMNIEQYIAIDYKKLGQDFQHMDNTQQLKLLLGLKWLLTKCKSKSLRRCFLISLIQSPFLNLTTPQIICSYLQQRQLKQPLLFLLCSVKNDYLGRSMVFGHQQFLRYLLQMINEVLEQKEYQNFGYLMDILATLSVYKDYAQILLDHNFPSYLLDVLEEYPELFQMDEILTYVIICLLNFCSDQQGIQKIKQNINVFTILSTVFSTNSIEGKSLIAGMYYTLLGDKQLFQLAYSVNLPQFISSLLQQTTSSSLTYQLSFVHSKLLTFQQSIFDEQRLYDGQSDGQVQDQDDWGDGIQGYQMLMARYGLKGKRGDDDEGKAREMVRRWEAQMDDQQIKKSTHKQPQDTNGKLILKQNLSEKIIQPKVDYYVKQVKQVKQVNKQPKQLQQNKQKKYQKKANQVLQVKPVANPVQQVKKAQASQVKYSHKIQVNKSNLIKQVKETQTKEVKQVNQVKKTQFKEANEVKKGQQVIKNKIQMTDYRFMYLNTGQQRRQVIISGYQDPKPTPTQIMPTFHSPSLHPQKPVTQSPSPNKKLKGKQLLKQINEEIREKKSFGKQDKTDIKKQGNIRGRQNFNKGKDTMLTTIVRKEKEAFVAKPKINRTPPKDQ